MQKYFYFQRISLFYFKCRVILKKFFTSPFFTSFCYHASLLHKSRLPSIQFTKQWIPQVKIPLDFPYTTKYRKYLCSISPRLFQGEKCLFFLYVIQKQRVRASSWYQSFLPWRSIKEVKYKLYPFLEVRAKALHISQPWFPSQ